MKVPAASDHLIIPIRILILGGLAYAIVLAVQFFFFGAGAEETDLEKPHRLFNALKSFGRLDHQSKSFWRAPQRRGRPSD